MSPPATFVIFLAATFAWLVVSDVAEWWWSNYVGAPAPPLWERIQQERLLAERRLEALMAYGVECLVEEAQFGEREIEAEVAIPSDEWYQP
jgi:hypothetical protein